MKSKQLKQLAFIFFVTMMFAIQSCKKETSSNSATDVYTSIKDFYEKNEVTMLHFSINAASGGQFTTPKGTIIRIPANAFINSTGAVVTGNVDIEFKDIYSKADMLLSNKPTITLWGTPLKSAGEFFIRAKANGLAVNLNGINAIEVVQPTAEKIDSAMQPFIANNDTIPIAGGVFAWGNGNQFGSIKDSIGHYIFSLYNFQSPADSGTWCNSDNSQFFNNFSQTVLTLHANDNVDSFNTDVFLVFKTVNSMIHVYRDYNNLQNFPYSYAPIGLQCTVVAIGIKNGKLHSSFTPITISNNQVVNFSLNETTTSDFVAALKLL